MRSKFSRWHMSSMHTATGLARSIFSYRLVILSTGEHQFSRFYVILVIFLALVRLLFVLLSRELALFAHWFQYLSFFSSVLFSFPYHNNTLHDVLSCVDIVAIRRHFRDRNW